MKAARLLPALLLLSGCASLTTTLRQPPAALGPRKGVVVFSTGASEASYTNVVLLRMQVAGKSGPGSLSGTDISVNRGYDDSDFKDEHGQVRMAVLDEGTYCFYPVLANPYLRLTGKIPNLAFRVKQGAVTYAGSLFMDGRAFSIRNKEQRDMEKALAAHPELGRLPKGTALARNLPECVPLP